MKIYVAGSSGEMTRAAGIISAIKTCPDLEVVHDWVAQIREVGEANPVGVPEALRRSWAMDSISGVQAAPLLWLLLPVSDTIGAWCEFTAAVCFRDNQSGYGPSFGTRRLIVTSGSNRERSIFTALADRHFDEDGNALIYFGDYARRWGIRPSQR